MATNDHRLRDRERRLAGAPGDLEGWVRLSRDYERVGRQREGCEVAVRAARHHAQDPRARARLHELGCGDGLWASARGGALSAGRGLLAGPARGVLRWRALLPRLPHGTPLVDVDGAVTLQVRPAGLLRVDPSGRESGWIDEAWPVEVTPILWGGRPAAYDPVVHDVRALGGDAAGPRWTAAHGAAGWRFGLGPAALEAVRPSGELGWRVRLPMPVSVASGAGALYVALADPQVRRDSPFDSPGRVVALDPETGAVLRVVDLGRSLCGDGQLAAAVAPGGALLAQLGMDLVCVEPGGELRWRTKLEWAGAPAVGRDAVIVASPTEGLVALGLATGERRWRLPELRTARAPLLDSDGVAYAAGTGWIAAVEPDGRRRFVLRPAGVGPLGPPALGPDRTLYVPSDGELLAVV